MKKLVICLAIVLAPALARADRLAVVDLTKVQAKSSAVKAGKTSADARRAVAQKRLTDMETALKKLEGSELYVSAQQNLNEAKKKMEAELGEAGKTADAALDAGFLSAVNAVAKKRKLTLVLPASAALYSGGALDITDEVVAQLDGEWKRREAEKKVAEAKPEAKPAPAPPAVPKK